MLPSGIIPHLDTGIANAQVDNTLAFQPGNNEFWPWRCWDDNISRTSASVCDNQLTDVEMLSGDDGWITGTGGLMLRWKGESWARWHISTTTDLYNLFGLSQSDVWAVGNGGIILHWDGVNWGTIPTPTIKPLYSIDLLSATDGWVVGFDVLLHWDGDTWTSVPNPQPNAIYYSVSMVASNDVWAVGEDEIIIHWDGNTWTKVTPAEFDKSQANEIITGKQSISFPIPPTPNFQSVAMVSATDGWIVGSMYEPNYYDLRPALLRWDGIQWNDATPADMPLGNDIEMLAPSAGWIAADGATLNWDGTQWITNTIPIDAQLTSISMVSHTDGFAVGKRVILHWDGQAWQTVLNRNPWSANFLRTVSMSSPDDGWAAGFDVLHWDGYAWNKIPGPEETSGMHVIAAVSPNEAWGMAQNSSLQGFIFHWDGNTWSMFGSPHAFYALQAIDMLSANEGWAAGYWNIGPEPLLLYWNGSEWQRIIPPVGVGLLSGIDMISSTDGWAVGYQPGASDTVLPLALHWDGSRWESVETPVVTDTILYDVSMISPTNGWAVGGGGGGSLLLHWNGTNWTQVDSPISASLRQVEMVSSTEAWAVGGPTSADAPAILHWKNGQWSEVSNPGRTNLYSLDMISPSEGWIVGEGGIIMHYEISYTYLPLIANQIKIDETMFHHPFDKVTEATNYR